MQASIGGKALDTSKIVTPKFNLFNFQKSTPTPTATIGGIGLSGKPQSSIGGKAMPTITQKQPLRRATIGGVGITPQPTQPVQQTQPQESLFDTYMKDENISKQGKFKMLSDVQSGKITEQEANEIIAQIYGENIPTQEAGLDSQKAVELVKQNRNQNLPAWKKVAKFGFDATVGSLGMVSEQVGNVGGFLGAEGMQQTGREIRDITTRTTGDSLGAKTGEFITGAGEMIATGPTNVAKTLLGRTAQGAMVGGITGAGMPILEKGNETTIGDIAQGGLVGGTVGAIATPVLEKAVIPAVSGIASKTMKYGTAGYQGGLTGLGKSIGRDVKAGIIQPFQKGAQNTASKITLGGIINPQKLGYVKNQLIVDEGVATPKDVGNWLLTRVKPGSKEEIVEQLIKYSENTKNAVDDSLSKIPTRFKSDTAKKALGQLEKDLDGVVGLEDELAKVRRYLEQEDYSLSDLQAIKRELDNRYNVYKQSGEVSANDKAQGLNKVRQQIKKFIEEEAGKYGVDIKRLNNDTAIARGLADGISRKDNADAVREFLTAFAPSGVGSVIGAGQSIAQGNDPLIVIRDALIGGVVAKTLTSTRVRTNIANTINKLGPKQMSQLEIFIKSGGKDAVGKKVAEQVLKDALKKPQLLLPQQSVVPKPATVTPQTLEKARIQESKAELSKAKIVNPMLKKSDKLNDYDIYKQGIDEANTVKELEEIKEFVKTHPKSKELLEEIDAKIDTMRAFQSIKEDVGAGMRQEYGDDLINAFKEVYKNEIMLKTTKGADKYSTIEFNKSAGFKRLSKKIEEYLSQSPWDDRTVQEVYETLKDKMINTSVKDLNKPKLLKPTQPTKAPKLLKKEGGELTNKREFVTPEGEKGVTFYINGNQKNGNVIITKTKDGYILNNILLDESLRGKGIGTDIHRKLNEMSIKDTGKPLNSIKPKRTTAGGDINELSEGSIGVWEKLVKSGEATKRKDGGYSFIDKNISPKSMSEKEYVTYSIDKYKKTKEFKNTPDGDKNWVLHSLDVDYSNEWRKVNNKLKPLSNNSGFINPTAVAKDITKAIKTLTPKNILLVSKQIATRLKVDTIKVQKVLREYMAKYGAELKDKAGDLFDDLADRLGVRSKFVDGKGTGISGKIEVSDSIKNSVLEKYAGDNSKFINVVDKGKNVNPSETANIIIGKNRFNLGINDNGSVLDIKHFFGENSRTGQGVNIMRAIQIKALKEGKSVRIGDSRLSDFYKKAGFREGNGSMEGDFFLKDSEIMWNEAKRLGLGKQGEGYIEKLGNMSFNERKNYIITEAEKDLIKNIETQLTKVPTKPLLKKTDGKGIIGKIEAPKELIEEAKRYKSADEFVLSKNKKDFKVLKGEKGNVLKLNGKDIGKVSYSNIYESKYSPVGNKTIQIGGIEINRNFQGLGIGRKFIKSLFDKNPITHIEVFPTDNALGFWEKIGAKYIANNKGYFSISKNDFNRIWQQANK